MTNTTQRISPADLAFNLPNGTWRIIVTYQGQNVQVSTGSAVMTYQAQRQVWDNCALEAQKHVFTHSPYRKDWQASDGHFEPWPGLEGFVLSLDDILNLKAGEWSQWYYTNPTTGDTHGVHIERLDTADTYDAAAHLYNWALNDSECYGMLGDALKAPGRVSHRALRIAELAAETHRRAVRGGDILPGQCSVSDILRASVMLSEWKGE